MCKTSPGLVLSLVTLALTAACGEIHGLQSYPTEAAATAACGDDEVVYGNLDHKTTGFWTYVTKESTFYGKNFYHGGAYACLAEMTRMKVPCGQQHNPDDGPLPASLAPACYNVPGKPKA
jgi:hypothetical protein